MSIISFRPLIGVSFCKLVDEFVSDILVGVSVPLSGLASVNEGLQEVLPSRAI